MEKPTLSIIIPTHNSQKTIQSCLNSLTDQSYPRDEFEIIVVDDGSVDETVMISKKIANQVIKVEPCFQGKARNIGAKNSKAEFLAFIDSDCIAKEDWIKSIVTELQKLDAVTGPIENGNSKSNVAWAEYLIEFGGWGKHRQRSAIRFIPGCNQAYRKEAFEKTSGFTEIPSSEDVLFGESLRQAGINPIFVPTIRIDHLCRTDKDKVLKNMKLLGKYSIRARKNNPSMVYSSLMNSRKLIPFLFIGKLGKTFYHSIKARKLTKFVISFSFIVHSIASFCKGAWNEIK